jgi:hypothetical protein
MRVLVCGGGNGAHVLAGVAASHKNCDARVLTLFSDEAARWTKTMGEHGFTVAFYEQGQIVRRITNKPELVTNDPSAAEGCDMIILVVPAFGHAQYIKAIEPYVKPGTTIIGLPGQAGFEFDVRGGLGEKAKSCNLVSFDSLPWACRIKEYGKEVHVLGTKQSLRGATFIGDSPSLNDPVAVLQGMIGERPQLLTSGNILGMTLMAVNAYIHTAILYARWHDWDGKPMAEAPLFYQGLDEHGANLMSTMSDEVLLIAKVIMEKYPQVDLSNVHHVIHFLLGAYSEEIEDSSTLQKAFSTNKAYIGLTHPMKKADSGEGLVPDYGHRYVSEDVPFGLVVIRGIAEVLNIPTPASDQVLLWLQSKMNKEYLVDGSIKGKDVPTSRSPQRYGFTTVEGILGL